MCAQFLSHKMSPSLHIFRIHQPWHAVKKMLTSLAKIYSPFLTTCAIHFFQPQEYSSTVLLPHTHGHSFFSSADTLSCSSSSPSSKTHSNCLSFSISVSHIRLAGQRANWQTQARYGSREIQTQPQSGLCLGGISNYSVGVDL